MQSIEHALRALDKLAEQEQEHSGRLGKTLADYQAQANKPFDHEARMKDLLARQAKLNAALDLDKNEKQVALPAENDVGLAGDIPQGPSIPLRVQRTSAPGMSP
jgi:anti-sigma factor ChrR (cupin superfamily)